MSKSRFLLPAVVLILLTAGLGIAGAHEFRGESAVTIRYNDDKDQFQGRVRATRPGCVQGRSVVLLKIRPRRDAIVGADRTNDNGRWRVPKRNPEGDFYAHVARRVKGQGRHRHVCRGDSSATITLP